MNSNIEWNSRSRGQLAPAMLVAACVALSACAVNGNSLPELTSSDQLVTNSVAEQARPNGVSKTDAEVIKSTVASIDDASRTEPLAWSNPETGSSGAIVAIDQFMGKHGQRCKGFKTTLSSFMGISYYDGEACQISPGEWVLSWFKSAD
ncbi:MAG: RT0821/Lpp0805 family surface protein [Pseudomonadota bacterium]